MKKSFFCFFVLMSALLQAQEFEVRIVLENAHVGELFFGCRQGAGTGYDRGLDIFCPPGGMGDTGLAWFAAPEPQLPSLYKDIKNSRFPQQWKLSVQPPMRKKMVLKWNREQLPENLEFEISGDGVKLDMKKTAELSVSSRGTLLISVRGTQIEPTDEKK